MELASAATNPSLNINWGKGMPRRLPKIDIGRVFHALDDATRREILERISKGPVSVSELAEPMLMSLAGGRSASAGAGGQLADPYGKSGAGTYLPDGAGRACGRRTVDS